MPPVPHQLAWRPSDNELVLIKHWRLQRLVLRKRLLQLLCTRLLTTPVPEQETCLQQLCGELIDYISTGHFKVYSGLLRRKSGLQQDLQHLLTYVFRCIGSSTDIVLDFNDSFDEANIPVGSSQMTEALNKLTRSLLVRFALEEQMLELTTGNNY